jgi:hypothetical protein
MRSCLAPVFLAKLDVILETKACTAPPVTDALPSPLASSLPEFRRARKGDEHSPR